MVRLILQDLTGDIEIFEGLTKPSVKQQSNKPTLEILYRNH